MNKTELIKKIDDLAGCINDIETDIKSLHYNLREAKDILEDLPGDASEIEEDDKFDKE